MEIITCYTVDINKQYSLIRDKKKKPVLMSEIPVDGRLMQKTSDICLAALKMCTEIFLSEWDYLSKLPKAQKKGTVSQKRGADMLIHITEDNPAVKYPEFDRKFPYMPSYTRRAVIADALGMVNSYKSNHENWMNEKPDVRGKEPTLGLPSHYELTFYDQERDICNLEKGIIGLKLYDGKIWQWYYFNINPADAKYISVMKASRKMLSPVVEKKNGRYCIRFSFKEQKKLVSNEDPLSYRILAVDLGINAPASWCVMDLDGTVHTKGVVHLNSDEERLNYYMNRKRIYQSEGKKPKNIYRMTTAANRQLSIDTSSEIIRLASLYDVDCIVFEYLDRLGTVKGKQYKERIHMWRAKDVQDRVELQAHRLGMRISRVCAWGTSKLACDGSGIVTRGKNAGLSTYSLCRFQNGKVYNCDISAAKNIGARFFIREYAKSGLFTDIPKVPQHTYATLIDIVNRMAA